ncbi:hypothetical protein WJX77_005932 [Trebouxia sp. C0004]
MIAFAESKIRMYDIISIPQAVSLALQLFPIYPLSKIRAQSRERTACKPLGCTFCGSSVSPCMRAEGTDRSHLVVPAQQYMAALMTIMHLLKTFLTDEADDSSDQVWSVSQAPYSDTMLYVISSSTQHHSLLGRPMMQLDVGMV